MGILPQDRLDAQGLDSSRLSVGPRLRLNLLDQLRDPLPVLLRREVRPAGKLRELQLFLLGVLEPPEVLPPVLGGELLRAVEPQALEGLAAEDRLGEVDSRATASPYPPGTP